jgi:hypothetical protein
LAAGAEAAAAEGASRLENPSPNTMTEQATKNDLDFDLTVVHHPSLSARRSVRMARYVCDIADDVVIVNIND